MGWRFVTYLLSIEYLNYYSKVDESWIMLKRNCNEKLKKFEI